MEGAVEGARLAAAVLLGGALHHLRRAAAQEGVEQREAARQVARLARLGVGGDGGRGRLLRDCVDEGARGAHRRSDEGVIHLAHKGLLLAKLDEVDEVDQRLGEQRERARRDVRRRLERDAVVVRAEQRRAEEAQKEDGADRAHAVVAAADGGSAEARVDGAADGGQEAAERDGHLRGDAGNSRGAWPNGTVAWGRGVGEGWWAAGLATGRAAITW
mmetsp:Transcript_32727/g.85578  ORF Transcript_32727/g.85578 Transcript_32727/m.85578 type:complete len:216 (-) Transcript_32727:38-685(-)